MKLFATALILLCSIFCQAQTAVQKTEQNLTDGSSKTWVYYETVKTMGVRKMSFNMCKGQELTYTLATKKYQGTVCEAEDDGQGDWIIEGDNLDEQYITMSETYMIDIYLKKINGVRTKVLRLKKQSMDQESPSIGHIYLAKDG